MMRVFIGAEHITSSLGQSAEENFLNLKANHSGIQKFEKVGFKKEDIYLSKVTAIDAKNKFDNLVEGSIAETKKRLIKEIISTGNTIVILSTTKGNIEDGFAGNIIKSINILQSKFSLKHAPLVVSNACASGVIAINTGADLIRAGLFSHAIVIGCDVISDFILFGFQSLFAIDNEPCSPYDKDRKGITLGEGSAAVVLSKDDLIFKEQPVEFMYGTSSNDANHISGPSRTGEGLYRTVTRTISSSQINVNEIDFISAHGTATMFNDDMESIALHRLGMSNIPMNSFKGYFGHTLGSAGVIETACCIQSMKNNLLIRSYGYKNAGTAEKINVLSENESKEVKVVLKTASGFGGCNASLLLKKI